MGIDFNGVNGNSPVFGNNNIGSTKGNEKTYDFGFGSKEVDSTVGLDNAKFSTKPAFTSFDLEQMYTMAGISKPESVEPLENTVRFLAEGAEHGVEYSEEDMNLARFMFEYLKA